MNTFQNSIVTGRQLTALLNNKKGLLRVKSTFYFLMWILSFILMLKFGFYIQKTSSVNTTIQNSHTDSIKRPQVLASFDTIANNDSSLPSADEIFDKVNDVRIQNGLKPLVKNSVLASLAQQRANDMVSRNYYAHEDPDGKMFYNTLDDMKYDMGFACENLDLSFVNNSNQYISDWFNSTHGHRECMLDSRITDAGYAVSSFDTGNESREYLIVAIHSENK